MLSAQSGRVMLSAQSGRMTKETRTFSTMTAALLTLEAWLEEQGVTHVAMESTGVYWYPVYNLLEQDRTILLVNPHHIKAVPGRTSDVKDSEWLADLLRHGVLNASFVPPRPIGHLRELTRYRTTLVQTRTQEVNRLQQVRERANITVAAVATDILGVSGREMLEARDAGGARCGRRSLRERSAKQRWPDGRGDGRTGAGTASFTDP
jgi:transposase